MSRKILSEYLFFRPWKILHDTFLSIFAAHILLILEYFSSFLCRKSKILSDSNQYFMPDNKLTEQNGEKSDESNEKYVIYEKAESEECEDGNKKDGEKQLKNLDKKIACEKLPPGWEKHEGECAFDLFLKNIENASLTSFFCSAINSHIKS
jgi:hypothetical protein